MNILCKIKSHMIFIMCEGCAIGLLQSSENVENKKLREKLIL